MLRREFFSFASGAAAIPATLIRDTGERSINELTEKLRDAIKNGLPGITEIEITFDPEDRRVPLMVLAFRSPS